jgi:hypothetical protein
MHGMLSAAIILVAFALVAAAGGGSTAWMYRAVSGPSRRSRPSAETVPTATEPTPEPAAAAPETVVDLPALPEGPERPALPPQAPRPALAAPPADDPAGDQAGDGGHGEPGSAEEFEGARIYVLDNSRRSGR